MPQNLCDFVIFPSCDSYFDTEIHLYFWWLNAKREVTPLLKHWNLCIKSLRSSNAIWWHGTGTTLAQVMACCLTAPSRYLNHCWLIINEVQHNHLKAISLEILQASATKYCLKMTYLKFHWNLSGAKELSQQFILWWSIQGAAQFTYRCYFIELGTHITNNFSSLIQIHWK